MNNGLIERTMFCQNDLNSHNKETPKMPRIVAPPVVVNITGTVLLEGPMDLDLYAEFLPCTEYLPAKFAALKFCCPSPFITSLIFRCGKIVCVGATSPRMLIESIEYIIQQLNQFEDGDGYITPLINIENIVACSNINQDLCLRQIHSSCPYFVHYEPEIFPGLSICLETEKGSILHKRERKAIKFRLLVLNNTWNLETDQSGNNPVSKNADVQIPSDVLEEHETLTEQIRRFRIAKRRHSCIKLVFFQTGKVNIVGCKSFEDIQEAYEFLIHLCEQTYFNT